MKNRILIFGASGLVGRYLYKYLEENKKSPIGTYNSNFFPGMEHFDISLSELSSIPLNNVSHAVICSAVTKLEKCKNDPEYSYKINVKSTKSLISSLLDRGVFPVFFSSASVFDGIKGGYKEDDERNPTSVYGKYKKEVEDFMISSISDCLIIRPGKVFGIMRGEDVLFTEWLSKYQKNEEIPLADDEKLSPIYSGDVARGTAQIIENNSRGIYHINPPEHYSRFEMASRFFKYLGINRARIKRCSIDDFNFSEKRQKNTYLDASKFISETGFSFTGLESCFEMIATKNL